MPLVIINLASYEYLVPDLTKAAFAERKAKVNQIIKEEPKMVDKEGRGYLPDNIRRYVG